MPRSTKTVFALLASSSSVAMGNQNWDGLWWFRIVNNFGAILIN